MTIKNEDEINSVDNDDGILRGPKHRCKRCRGSGQVPGIKKITNMGKGMGSEYGVCPDCDGLGWLYDIPIDPKTSKLD